MTSSTPSDTFYRYDDSYYGGYHHIREVRIHETVLKVQKRTKCGVWLVPPGWNDGDTIHSLDDRPRFVNLSALRRYAYESRKLALESFLARKFKQSKILKRKLADIDMAFWEAKHMLSKVSEQPIAISSKEG